MCKSIAIPGLAIWSIEKDGTNLWFGTDEGLVRKSQSGAIETFQFGTNSSTFRLVKKLSNGKLFVAGDEGIGWIENEKLKRFPPSAQVQTGTVRDAIIYNGKLICAGSKGLFESDKNNIRLLKRFSSGVVSLKIDDLNRLWIGTENGLFYFDGIRFTPVQIGNNSGARFINFIEKVKGTIYVGTNNGVYVFDCSGQIPITLKHIGINSGLMNLESNINSSYFDDEFLWFGTAEGLVRIKVPTDPSGFIKSTVPQVSITKILINYQNFNYLDYTKALSSAGIPLSLRLPHTKNNISIELDGLLLSDPEAVLFQYWLEGQDATWSPVTSNSTLIFTNLSDGDYKLHIRALNELGRISNEQLIPITITPPFWRRWWFYTLLVIVLLAAIRYYFNWQLKQERSRNYKENLENKSRLLALEQQSLNASLNRHFIFNSLNSIQYFINTQDRVSANRYLTSFAKLIRKNLDTAAEGDNMVTLDQELERLELYLSLESMRFKDRFTYEINANDIDVEQIVVPAMLLQPFVENSIIHGILPDEKKKGVILIVLKIIGQQLEICIDDNGIGIEYSLNKKTEFEGDHKSQGMEITSKRINLIRKIWKKDYELIGPFQMLNSDQSIKGTRVLIKIPLDYLEN